ncbi:YtxH domain-containing protein [Nitrospira sp. Kam-Ns4a]
MASNGKEIVKVAALVAGGTVVGAGLGLLLAPQSGAETRRQIRHYAKRAKWEATRFSRSVKAGVERAIERSKMLLPKKEEKPAIEAA